MRKPKDLDLGFNLPQETELDSIIKQLYDEFMQRYKAKQYEITEVLVPNKDTLKNEFIEFVQNHRYMYSSTVQMLDGATNTLSQYLNMKAGEFTFKADGSISGGPKYDAKRGMREGYSKLGTAALYALGFTFSGGGVLVSLASPFLLLAAPAVIGAAGLVIPLVQNVKKRRIEQNNYEFSNKSEAQNESVKQNAFERISKIVDELQVKYKNGKAECKTDKRDFCLSSDDEQVFLSALNAIEQELICGLSQNRNGGTFHMKDGKSIINGANAHEFSEYRKKINNVPDVIKDLESREQEINREIEKLKESKDKNKETKIKDAQNRLAKVLDDKRNTQTELEKAKAGENFIISGTNNETDPELEEILNRIENAKKFVRAKYFRKMNGEWIKDVGNNKGIVNLDELINKTLEAGEDKKEIRSALISFVMHTDITVDVKGKNFRFVNSHEKYSDDKNIDWKKVKEIAAKHGLFIDETLGMQTIEDKIETVNVAKPIPTTKKETEKETEVKKEAEKETENEAEKDKETEKETVKKPEKELKQRGLSALIKKFNTADFKQYFKLIELDNKSKRKGLVYREDAKKAILNHIKQYELYKGLLYKTIAELENKASLSEKQKEKLEKLRYFRDESEYLIKSFNNSYGSFSKDEEEKSL